MGMFDYLIIDSQKLPASPQEKELLKNEVFQTKDLEKSLLSYEINNDDELMLQNIMDKDSGTLISFFREFESEIKPAESEIIYEKIPFHGFINFYTYVNDIWYDFKAKFTDAKLVSIERIPKND